MKKIVSLVLSVLMLISLVACENSSKQATVLTGAAVEPKSEQTELIVFAAASMPETMNQIKEMYEKKNPNIKITYNFDSSGTLLKQIVAGADYQWLSHGRGWRVHPPRLRQWEIRLGPSRSHRRLD